MSKTFLAAIIAILLLFGGIVAVNSHKDAKTTTKSSVAKATSHIEGKGSKGVTLVEYGDYQCPFCGQAYPIVKQVVDTYKDDIYFQFRNFPLTNLHRNAFAAARAAEAAGLQGKYWEMHDALYQSQDPNGQSGWVASNDPSAYFTKFAQQLGLNATKFKQDYASDQVNDAVNADMAAGNKLGVSATPTFYLDDKKLDTTLSFDAFKKYIDAEIAKKAPAAKTDTSAQPATN